MRATEPFSIPLRQESSIKTAALHAELFAQDCHWFVADHRPIEAGQLEVDSTGREDPAEQTHIKNEGHYYARLSSPERHLDPSGAIVPAALPREHLDMKTFFRVALWILALVLGLFVWNVTPDFRPIINWVLAAAFVCYVLSIIVEVTIKRLIVAELLELRRQGNATVNRLDLLDRKVTAILRDALEQRRFR